MVAGLRTVVVRLIPVLALRSAVQVEIEPV
jgi:hypothetical protein